MFSACGCTARSDGGVIGSRCSERVSRGTKDIDPHCPIGAQAWAMALAVRGQGLLRRAAPSPDPGHAGPSPLEPPLPMRSSSCGLLQAVMTLAGTMLLAACAVPGEGPRLSADTPAAMGLAASAPSSQSLPIQPGWWHTLGDPQLDRVMDDALGGNPSLAGAQARLAARVATPRRRRRASSLAPGGSRKGGARPAHVGPGAEVGAGVRGRALPCS